MAATHDMKFVSEKNIEVSVSRVFIYEVHSFFC